jgi:glycosyltransferase involved in cell wall biosynthesis
MVSTYEGFGLPLVEAQAVGRPVLSSNVGPIPEVAGGGALLVDPTSVRDIRDGLDLLIRDHDVRDRLVYTGLSNVKRFRKANVASQYAALYDEMRRAAGTAVRRETLG